VPIALARYERRRRTAERRREPRTTQNIIFHEMTASTIPSITMKVELMKIRVKLV
jgi:hypothetical protein